MDYNTFYIDNFIGRFNTALGCKIKQGDLAKALIALGCHKAPSKMWYRSEVEYVFKNKLVKIAQILRTLGYEIKPVVPLSLYPMRQSAKPASSQIQNTSVNQQNTSVQQIRRPVIPIPAEDETNMDYVSYKLLKDDEVFYDHEDESIDALIERYGKMSIIKYIRSLD